MKTLSYFSLLSIIILVSCGKVPEQATGTPCGEMNLQYSLEGMEDYADMEIKQSYFTQNEDKLLIVFKNYESRADDKQLKDGELDIELILACVKPEACPENTFKATDYPMDSYKAVEKGFGVRPKFRSKDGVLPFYEVSNQEGKGPQRAEGHVVINTLNSKRICGEVQIIDTHGKSIKGKFSAEAMAPAENE